MVLGLPDGMLGAAWPEMHRSLHVPLDALGAVLLAVTAGAAAVSSITGRLLARAGIGKLLAAAGSVAVAGAAGFAVSPSLALLMPAAAGLGLAAGLIDGGLNTVVGVGGRSRLLNLLHGAYGVGTAVGPLLVTAALLAGRGWRPAYAALAVAEAVVAASWWGLHRHPATVRPKGPDPASAVARAAAELPGPAAAPAAKRREHRVPRSPNLALAAGLLAFFSYTGLEVAAGQWDASYCREHLHLSVAAAGLSVFGYWGCLAAVRIGLAVAPHPPSPKSVVRVGVVGALIGTAGIWLTPGRVLPPVAFALTGAALAGVFPALVGLTPSRLGESRARHAIAWQVGAATIGGSVLSALVGLVASSGLGLLGPSLLVLAVVVALAAVLQERLAPA